MSDSAHYKSILRLSSQTNCWLLQITQPSQPIT